MPRSNKRKLRIIGVPLDLGQERRGVDMGPSALRVADVNARIGALGFEVDDAGNVAVPIREMQHPGNHRAKYLKAIAEACKRQATWVLRTLRQGYFPLVLGGDHSIAVGTVAGVAEYYRRKGKQVGLIWVDAHADMNTPETSPSGNIHGMPLACCLGYGPKELTHLLDTAPSISPRNAVLVGVRSIDSSEKQTVTESGLTVYTMRQIDERSLRTVMEEAIAIADRDTAGFAVTLDMDFVDPSEAPGVGTPVRGGATYREAHLVMEMIADSRRMLSLEVVEVNPVIDVANRTANLAVELVLSALGKKIL
ncbi:MAG: arginase [Acidobacteria bacterium]|nr:arginase [Acidobacteriota bacterium]